MKVISIKISNLTISLLGNMELEALLFQMVIVTLVDFRKIKWMEEVLTLKNMDKLILDFGKALN